MFSNPAPARTLPINHRPILARDVPLVEDIVRDVSKFVKLVVRVVELDALDDVAVGTGRVSVDVHVAEPQRSRQIR